MDFYELLIVTRTEYSHNMKSFYISKVWFFQTEYKQDLASPGLTERLPEECVREILLRLDTGEDIVRAGDACALMGGIAKETRIWRELVQSHFTPDQIAYVVNTKPQLQVTSTALNLQVKRYIFDDDICIYTQ